MVDQHESPITLKASITNYSIFSHHYYVCLLSYSFVVLLLPHHVYLFRLKTTFPRGLSSFSFSTCSFMNIISLQHERNEWSQKLINNP